jgi:hypothetical protein
MEFRLDSRRRPGKGSKEKGGKDKKGARGGGADWDSWRVGLLSIPTQHTTPN